MADPLTPYQGMKCCHGVFVCIKCKRTWHSNTSYANCAQACRKCFIQVYPKSQYPLHNVSKKRQEDVPFAQRTERGQRMYSKHEDIKHSEDEKHDISSHETFEECYRPQRETYYNSAAGNYSDYGRIEYDTGIAPPAHIFVTPNNYQAQRQQHMDREDDVWNHQWYDGLEPSEYCRVRYHIEAFIHTPERPLPFLDVRLYGVTRDGFLCCDSIMRIAIAAEEFLTDQSMQYNRQLPAMPVMELLLLDLKLWLQQQWNMK